MKIRFYFLLVVACLISCTSSRTLPNTIAKQQLNSVNTSEIPVGQSTIAIINVNIIDGNGGSAVLNGCVLVKDGRIAEVGQMGSFTAID